MFQSKSHNIKQEELEDMYSSYSVLRSNPSSNKPPWVEIEEEKQPPVTLIEPYQQIQKKWVQSEMPEEQEDKPEKGEFKAPMSVDFGE